MSSVSFLLYVEASRRDLKELQFLISHFIITQNIAFIRVEETMLLKRFATAALPFLLVHFLGRPPITSYKSEDEEVHDRGQEAGRRRSGRPRSRRCGLQDSHVAEGAMKTIKVCITP